jgi:putative transcriptional regulator
MAKAYKSEAMAAVHEMMEGFYQSGAIDKQTMREFDDACLTAVEPMPPRKSAQSGSANTCRNQSLPGIST